jgi:hypothetical protein
MIYYSDFKKYTWTHVPALRSFSIVVELRGFEPRTFALPARRSSQLSYSPEKPNI